MYRFSNSLSFLFVTYISVAQLASPFIHVDQFGYLPNAEKVAVLSDPSVGYNSGLTFNPSATVDVRDVNSNSVVFSGSAQPWNGGGIHPESGDRGWWFDMSSITTPGTYVVESNGEVSPEFRIRNDVYNAVLKDAGRMFYYNRCNHPKSTPFAHPNWTDGMDFMGTLQDANCRFIDDPNNSNLEKDLSGGWYDAGDYNKYFSFAASAVHHLLMAYEENPQAFNDDWDIPESGNGIPDLLDEVKWELDWMRKMNNADGSTHIKMGSQNYSENTDSPPSSNSDQRFYGPTCSSASICAAMVFAQAAHVFSAFPAMSSFSSDLEGRAIASYNNWFSYFITNTVEIECDDGSIVSGDTDLDLEDQMHMALAAAAYLFRQTGDPSYSAFIQSAHLSAEQIDVPYWGVYKMSSNDGLLMYSELPNANGIVASAISNAVSSAASNNWNGYFGFNEDEDLYRGFIPSWSYHWGSNQTKAHYGNLNMSLVHNGINTANISDYERAGAEMVHYFHGVNPLGLVYLSNMNGRGATRSCNEIYHTWFYHLTDWDNAQTSLYGPPPGYVTGGPNASNSITMHSPPFNQPAMKSYLDFNTGWPEKSWEVSEPAIYYQAAYIRLLANFVDATITTNVSQVSAQDPTIIPYPNPSTGIVIISGASSGMNVLVRDVSGRQVKRSTLGADLSLDLSDHAPGTYILSITDSGGQIVDQVTLLLDH